MPLQRIAYKDLEQFPHLQIKQNFKQEFAGSAPAPFIGRFGYPQVNIGILSPQISGDTSFYDSPKGWSRAKLPIDSIASLRYGLVNSRTTWKVKQITNNQFLEICQEVAMAAKPAEVEVKLKEQPKLELKPDREIIPFGPQSELQKARLTSNPRVDTRVERVVVDTDLKASNGLLDLYRKGFEENTLTKLLSVGTLGLKQNRKLVPTRWSITAVDDTLGKQLIQEIKDLPVGEYRCYFGGAWGNYYLLLFFPEIWSFELFETYIEYQVNPWSKAGMFYSTDYEDYNGRKKYAEECAGGYYACRLPILEKMKELKRQQSCLALRFITPDYKIPLGVWICREATRESMNSQPIQFASEELMLRYARELIRRKFSFDADLLLKESRLLKNKKQQKKLTQFA
ncbi:hypothetical protein HYX14_03620 [Candidatus Woesearchaeota archaeon]|nr:hypothetical protein [Candidatus Woesearchaeota archaeon]